MDDYGRKRPTWSVNEGRTVADTTLANGLDLRLMSDIRLGDDAGVISGSHWLEEGEECFVALQLGRAARGSRDRGAGARGDPR